MGVVRGHRRSLKIWTAIHPRGIDAPMFQFMLTVIAPDRAFPWSVSGWVVAVAGMTIHDIPVAAWRGVLVVVN